MAKMLFACTRRLGPWCLVLFLFVPVASASAPARVSYVEGTAAVAQEGDVDWLEISVNMPVRAQDRIVLQHDGLLELELDFGNVLRLGPDADVLFENVSPSRLQVSLTSGTIILRIRESLSAEVVTPSSRVRFARSGLYRVASTGRGGVQVAVRKGEAEAVTEAASKTLTTGEVLTVAGPEDQLANVSLIDIKDDFDVWSDRRDAGRASSRSSSYVGNGYAGTHDLDRYGDWDYDDGYGWVWWPSVSIGWCPYRVGDWYFYPSWGWTWVSYEPWGWLPYHYGRWMYSSYRSRWCWSPFDMTVWSPALAVFYSDNNAIRWAPRTFDDDRRGRARITDVPRAGLTSQSREEFLRRARVRSERRTAAVAEVALPGTQERVPVPRSRANNVTNRGSQPVTIGGGADARELSPWSPARREAARSDRQPRVITIGPDRPSRVTGNYPNSRDLRRLPPEALVERRRSVGPGYRPGWYDSSRDLRERGGYRDRGGYGRSEAGSGWWIPASPDSRPGNQQPGGRDRMESPERRDGGRTPSYDRPSRQAEPREYRGSPNRGREDSGRSSGGGRGSGAGSRSSGRGR